MKTRFLRLAIVALAAGGLLFGLLRSEIPSALAVDDSAEAIQLKRLSEEMLRLHKTADVPVGTVVALAASKVPDGWLSCDGRTLNRDEYPELYAAIGDLYGRGAGEGEFKLPDYRGMFLRGVDAEKEVEKDRGDRTPPSDAPKSATFLGSMQGAATAVPTKAWDVTLKDAGAHSHDVVTKNEGDGYNARAVRFIPVPGRQPQDNPRFKEPNGHESPNTTGHRRDLIGIRWPDCKDISVPAGGEHTHAASMRGGDGETRPVNTAVLYVIKARRAAQPAVAAGNAEDQLRDLVTVSDRLSQQLDVPVGTVVAFAGANVPQGWLVCDGRLVNKAEYPRLYAAIGDLYGGTSEGKFKLPDYRGMFLRGVDPEKLVDKDRDDRKAPSDASKAAAFLGSVQASATGMPVKGWVVTVEKAGAHTHSVDAGGGRLVHAVDFTSDGSDGWGYEWCHTWAECREIAIGVSGSHTHRVTVTGGDSETRPRNISVYYLIKAISTQ